MAAQRPGLLPTLPLDPETRRVIDPIADILSRITSSTNRGNRLKLLPTTATTADLITAVNAIITRLQED